jgi:ATP:ADP antiporter, AAA family
MQSAEAKAMEESVNSSSSGATSWNAMTTATTTTTGVASSSTPNDDDLDEVEEGAELTTSKKAKEKDDIYAGLSEPTKPHPDRDDDFLDRPVWESRATGWRRVGVVCGRTLESAVHRLYGNQLPLSEFLRTLCLATTLFFMIGGYWLMRSLKDPVLTALCGVSVIPKAKMLSVVVVLFVVSIYNKLLDTDIPKHKLFYIFGMFYFGLFMVIAVLLMDPQLGLANEQPSPWRIMGWISYCSIESFGSVMVSLFWSFANSNISLETAKASYGVMVATAQVGSILGPTFVSVAAPRIGTARCYMAGALCMLLLQGTMYMYISIYGVQEKQVVKHKEKAGVLEGLELFAKHNYVKGIFAISCLFMVGVTIVDYTMKVLAQQYFAEEHPCEMGDNCYDGIAPGVHGMSRDATTAFTAFMGVFGQATNILSLLLSLFGTSAVIRYLGLRLTLLLFPSLVLVVVIIVRFNPTLYTTFGAMMALKASSYALNNPTKEILYQPTSPAVRYKAKSWIDIFGARGSKALGSVVTNAFSDSAANLVSNGTLVGMAVASFLIWNARFMGKKFEEYTASGYIVGGDDNPDNAESGDAVMNLEMALSQNEGKDTSCAIYDDDNDDDKVGPLEEGQSKEGDADDESAQQFAKKPEVRMV